MDHNVSESRVPRARLRVPSGVGLAVLLALLLVRPGAGQAPATPAQAPPPKLNSLDAFMSRVLERRDETWRKLHDYVLDETEQFRILGPGGVPLHGMKREFTWYVREGFLIRSPVKYDGVTLNESDRRAYEQRWLEQEKRREERAAKRAAQAGRGDAAKAGEDRPPDEAAPAATDASLQAFVDQRGEPRFISEAYFLRFKFEPGNYYAAGRDTLDGRPVVKIEYYPTRLFEDDHERDEDKKRETSPDRSKKKDEEEEFARKFNKVALVTLWVDQGEYQIVRYTFDNIDFGFLPARWLVRLDEIHASMTMARVLDGVWLPAEIDMRGGLSLASGAYRFEYGRHFTNYRKAETGARIRNMAPRDR
jgi:hypothetical protein